MMDYKIIFVFVVVITFTLVNGQENITEDDDCKHCDLASCRLPDKCHAGIVRDKCGCCEVCALEEGQLCNFSPTKAGPFWHGFCGAGMECRKRKDIDSKKITSQSICVCEKPDLVCATNGVTYTPCQMAAINSKSDKQITHKHNGPCLTRPKIISSSVGEAVKQGTKHTLLCEVQGFPIPTIEWMFKAPGGTYSTTLPGDSEEISVSVRGGPEKLRVTGYLQITDFQLKHEGDYECVAHGDDGIVSKKMSLVFKRNVKSDL